MSALDIQNVCKDFGATHVLRDINLSIASGEFLILVGPSGCGKSTLMNAIAGLEPVSGGRILIGGDDVTRRTPAERDIAMVFQSYALYPGMTVRGNIAFGLEMRKVPKAQRQAVVDRVAAMLQIEHLLERKPSQLSGGQRQRVAMGRALARQPRIYLFDEPLSNLDAKLRVEMRTEIKRLHHDLGTTIVYVTHDQIEAMTLGDRIAVMRDGKVLQLGTPADVYDDPVDMFVAGFMGSPCMNFIRAELGKMEQGYAVSVQQASGQPLLLPLPPRTPRAGLDGLLGREVVLGVRPEHISQRGSGLENGADHIHPLRAAVTVMEPTGADLVLRLQLGGGEVTARVEPKSRAVPGEVLDLQVDMGRAVLFDPASEVRLY